MALTTDSSTNNQQLTANGDVSVNTTTYKHGGGSAYFDGDGDYIQTEIDVGNNFTIEGWVRRVGTAYGTIFEIGDINPSRYGMHLAINSNGEWSLDDAQTTSIVAGSAPLNTWVHFAVVRNNGTNKLYINGVLIGTSSQGFPKQNNIIRIGAAPNYSFYFEGYIDDFQILKGVAKYTQNFTPSQNELPDPYDENGNNVSLLLHMNGTNGAQTFNDSSNNNFTITTVGDTYTDTFVKKFGESSASFDGDGDYLQLTPTDAFNFYNTDFTIECWIYSNANQTGGGIISTRNAGVYSPWELQLGYPNNNHITLLINNGTSWYGPSNGFFSYAVIPQNEWVHLAWVCQNSNHTVYVNGFSDPNLTNLNAPIIEAASQPDDIFIGLGGDGGFAGFIDELRVTKGIARYTSNFVPQTAPFANPTQDPYISNVSLLMHMNGTEGSQAFTDSSQNNFTITVNGETYIDTVTKKFGESSAYFDGNNDYLQIPASTWFDFGTDDFTIEFWINLDAGGGGTCVAMWGGGLNAFFTYATENDGVIIYINNAQIFGFGSTTLIPNVWYHIALARDGTNIRLFIDGIQSTEGPYNIGTNPIGGSANVVRIGRDETGNPPFKGYIDDVRITKGIARYTADFALPIIEFPNT